MCDEVGEPALVDQLLEWIGVSMLDHVPCDWDESVSSERDWDALGIKSGMERGSDKGSMASMSISANGSAEDGVSTCGDDAVVIGGHLNNLRVDSSSAAELSSSSEQVALSGTLFVPPLRSLEARFCRVGPMWDVVEGS